MITFLQIQKRLKAHKEILLSRYSVKSMAVFGSYAYGHPKASSDVDILIDFKKTPDLFEFLEVESYLEKILGRRVDLVRRSALRKELRYVLDHAISV